MMDHLDRKPGAHPRDAPASARPVYQAPRLLKKVAFTTLTLSPGASPSASGFTGSGPLAGGMAGN